MVKYKIIVKRSAEKELAAIPKVYLIPITNLIGSLANNPRPSGCEKLSGDEKYRIRKGPYRIVCSIHDRELLVWIVKVAHRKDVDR